MLGTTLLVALGVLAAKSHYLLLFAHQDAPYGQRPDPHTAHSFASWIETDGDAIAKEFTISWTGIHGVKFLEGPQPSRLLSLEQSLARARRRCLPVTMWGPLRISPCAFERAERIHQRLSCGERTGAVQYNVLDWKTRSERDPQAINCIHVLTDVAEPGMRTGSRYGISASEFILEQYIGRGLVQGSDPSAEWIWEALRGDYTVRRRPSRALVVDSEPLVARSEPDDPG